MKTLQITSDDRTRLRLIRWGEAERDILLLHGLAEHAGRYEHVAQALVEAGWRVNVLELRGHGDSSGKRGHVRRWHAYVEDVQAAAATIGRPFVMLAHSMGGLVALSALSEPIFPQCTAVALTNPLLGVRVKAPRWKTAIARVLSKFAPSLSMANELDTSLISHDTEVVRAYETDPQIYGTITPRWFTEMSTAQSAVHARSSKFTIPLRMMVSEGDQICDPDAARRLALAWGGPSEIIEYGDMYHEIFNEIEKYKVISELVTWLGTLDAE
jgi:alpha-beta hydrolase superfamily lysophospholipase